MKLEGKVAIITGAASGIGEATARLFAENGAFVIIADIQDDLGEEVAASIGHHRAIYKRCDITNEEQVEETVKFAVDKYGKLDIMHSNAAINGPQGSILDLDVDEFDNMMAVNCRGSALAVKHAASAMVASKTRGSIICTGSVAATLGGCGPHSYTISKHAVVGLVRSASSELGKYGIRVNCVSPFGVATPMATRNPMHNVDPGRFEAITCAMSNLKGIVLKVNHVAEAALFLASDSSAYISGHNLAVDGGITVVSSIMSSTITTT
uniref:Uncharacterized protein n=1 Tax=Kalanchoe fedtschenkoi TaxID=63787 RepID=A0A7N0ZTE7_KALFE